MAQNPEVIKIYNLPEKPDAIIFDWDNTLIDSWPLIYRTVEIVHTAMGMEPWTLEQTKKRIGASLRDIFPKMFGDRWEEAREIYYKSFEELHLDYLNPLDGCDELLQTVAAQVPYAAIVSNKTGHYLRDEASVLGWNNYFGKIVGANDAKRDKPDKAPVIMALEGSNLSLDDGAHQKRIWFVGDSHVDVQCACNARIASILIRPEPYEDGEFGAHKPDVWVKNCSELASFVKKMAVI